MIATREQKMNGRSRAPRRDAKSTRTQSTRQSDERRSAVTVGAFSFQVPPTGDAELDDFRVRILKTFKGTGPENAVRVGVLCEVLEIPCGGVADIVAGLKSQGFPIEPLTTTRNGQAVESYYVAHGSLDKVGDADGDLASRIVALIRDHGAYCPKTSMAIDLIQELIGDATSEQIAAALHCFTGVDFVIVRAIELKHREHREHRDCYYMIQTRAGLGRYLRELRQQLADLADERKAFEGAWKYLAEV